MEHRESSVDNSPTEIFIGARDLKKEVYNILPTYDQLLKQIEQIREQSRNEAGKRRLSGTNYRKDVNNTIGIFGQRGTGKTSVLFTLINGLNPEIDACSLGAPTHNMVLGIVEPDHFGDNTKIMGSVVGLLKKMVEQQLKQIQKLEQCNTGEFPDYFTKGMYRSNNPLHTKMNELIEFHMYTENEYRQLLIHTYDDLATHIKKSARLLTPDMEFKEKLHELITELIANQRILLKPKDRSRTCKQEPLLILFIDDIDLKMTRSRELIEAILQYANHPNVVTVLSGDYEILREAISLALIQDEGLAQSNLSVKYKPNDGDSIKVRKQTLAHEYVKKIIPPARRHHLLQWNDETIPRFAFDKLTFMDQLDKLFGHKTLFSYKKEEAGPLIPITMSYSIFDRTPRGIVNVYYHIHEINSRLAEQWRSGRALTEDERKERFMSVKSLIDTILLSSTRLASVQHSILERFLKWGQDAGNTFLAYSEVKLIVAEEPGRERYKDSLMLPLIIIGEVIHSLLPDIRFNLSECRELQMDMLRKLLQLDEDRLRNPQGNFVRMLLGFIHFQHALFFTQQLMEKKEWLIQVTEGGPEQSTLWFERRNQWLLTEVNALLVEGREGGLLKQLYYEQYIHSKKYSSQLSEAGELVRYLRETSASRGNYVYYKSLYEYPLSSGIWSLMGSWLEREDYPVELFVNLLIELHEPGNIWVEEAMKLQEEKPGETAAEKVKQPPATRLKRVLSSLRKKQEEDADFKPTSAHMNRINALIDQFYNTMFERLRNQVEIGELTIGWKNTEVLKQSLAEFNKGYSGVTNTKYFITKVKVKDSNIEGNGYSGYKYCRYWVHELAANYAVWYGRRQAEVLIMVLREQAYLAPDNLEADELWVLKHLKLYLEQVNEAVHVDESYERVKAEIRHKLDRGFDAAMELVVTDLDVIGFDLDDDEDTDGDD